MPTTYNILGQTLPTQNTLSNVYVVPTSTSTILNTITICNQSAANANVDIIDRKSTRLNSSHVSESRMPSSA